MALLAAMRRLKLHRLHLVTRLSQFSHSLPHQFISYGAAASRGFFSKAFYQTPFRLCKHNAHLSRTLHAYGRDLDQIINFEKYIDENGEDIQLGFPEFLEKIQKAKEFAYGDEALAFLDNSCVKPDKIFILSLIWALREEWKLAFLVFKWGQKWDCIVEKTWCLMIWLLGNHKKFSTAWILIHELYRGSKDTQQAMLIMIDRYVAANQIDKAIETFHMMQKFKFSPDQSPFSIFLNILCKHGNIEEAEQFMFLNKKFFPLETESFNIILHGWCNMVIDISEAKRVWREMSKCCIEPNGTSYALLISCYSKVGNLFESLRLYDEMNKKNWVPGVDVYHCLIYVLTRENCSSEALKIIDKMKEMGLKPNSTTYNCIIRPLCEAKKFEEARSILSRMMECGISPTIDAYHALLEGENLEGILGVLNHLKKLGLGPNRDTFVLLVDKFLKLSQPENALKLWSEMEKYGVKPDCGLYVILVEGLVKCHSIVKARKLYSEMVSVGFGDDPVLKKLLEEPVQEARKGKGEVTIVRRVKRGKGFRFGKSSVSRTVRRRKQREKKKKKGSE